MGALARSGTISRREDGVWILHGAPPAELRHHRLVAAMT
jgi:CRP/FNR family transcriptional regulator, cyclic AMP receptor protein